MGHFTLSIVKGDTRVSSRVQVQARREILRMLHEDHRRVNAAFQNFKRLWAAADVETCAALVRWVCAEVTINLELEDTVFYPVVESLVEETWLGRVKIEHRVIRVLIDQVKDLAPQDPHFEAGFMALGTYLQHHLIVEEGRIFRQLSSVDANWIQLRDDMHDAVEALRSRTERSIDSEQFYFTPPRTMAGMESAPALSRIA